jgi:hypothetical protein
MAFRNWFTAVAALCLGLSACVPDAEAPRDTAPTARTTGGVLTGLALDGLADGGEFRGVPFACYILLSHIHPFFALNN